MCNFRAPLRFITVGGATYPSNKAGGSELLVSLSLWLELGDYLVNHEKEPGDPTTLDCFSSFISHYRIR